MSRPTLPDVAVALGVEAGVEAGVDAGGDVGAAVDPSAGVRLVSGLAVPVVVRDASASGVAGVGAAAAGDAALTAAVPTSIVLPSTVRGEATEGAVASAAGGSVGPQATRAAQANTSPAMESLESGRTSHLPQSVSRATLREARRPCPNREMTRGPGTLRDAFRTFQAHRSRVLGRGFGQLSNGSGRTATRRR
ncbi:MAG: hypothetical protein AB7F65_03395 [Dehalococcoidia bacterium]